MSLTALLKKIGLSHISGTLEDFGITTTKDLSMLREVDLNDIITELNLKPRQRIKFRVAVRKLEVEDVSRIVLTAEEERAVKSLFTVTNAAKSSIKLIENTMEAVRNNGKQSRDKISAEFLKHRKQLEKREKSLIADVNAKEKEKITALEKQCYSLSSTIAQLTQAQIDSDKIMNRKASSTDGIEQREKAVAAKIAEASKLKFPRKAATTPHIRYESDEKELNQNICQHGAVALYAKIKPPTISRLQETHDTIQVFWKTHAEPGASQEALPIGFGIVVTELASTGKEGSSLKTEYESDGKEDNFLVKDLRNDTNYELCVKVKNKFGWSSYGTSSSTKTKKEPPRTRFVGSTLLDDKSTSKVCEFIGGQYETNLLYKASQHGFGANDFHRRCDNKGPTVTIVKRNGSETIFGGFTPLNWNTCGTWVNDDQLRAFLFTMNDDNGNPAKYQQKDRNSIYCRSDYGPTFGGGHDLHICDNSNARTSSYASPSSYTRPSNTSLCGQLSDWKVNEVEVFSIAK